jgi:hypothetical protein
MNNSDECETCDACDNGRFWCRGCGGCSKKEALLESKLFTKRQVEKIYLYQSGGCDKQFVPCFLCNRNGQIPCREIIDKGFWNTFKIK